MSRLLSTTQVSRVAACQSFSADGNVIPEIAPGNAVENTRTRAVVTSRFATIRAMFKLQAVYFCRYTFASRKGFWP